MHTKQDQKTLLTNKTVEDQGIDSATEKEEELDEEEIEKLTKI